MKLIFKSWWNRMLVAAICGVVVQNAYAQSDNGFAAESEWNRPFQDNAVATADFQKQIIQSEPGCELNSKRSTGLTGQSLDSVDLSSDRQTNASWTSQLQQRFEGVDVTRVLGSLAIVVGGYLGFVWLTRKLGTGGSQGLPQEVVEVLGQSPFGPKKSLQLVRLGSKLLLLMNNSDGTQTVGEITDPHEVEYLVSLCGGRKANRSAIAIRKASTANTNTGPNTDLKKILRQLERATDGPGNGSVFEA